MPPRKPQGDSQNRNRDKTQTAEADQSPPGVRMAINIREVEIIVIEESGD
jgi:hypothetical protein